MTGRPAGTRLRRWVTATARIARWEVARSAITVDRKTVLAVVAMLLVVGVSGVAVVDDGAGLEDDIYRVAAEPGSPYEPVVAADDRLAGVRATHEEFVTGEVAADLYVDGPDHVDHDGTSTGEAAYDAFREAVERYNEELMGAEANETAAYPVTVEIAYDQRTAPDRIGGADAGSRGGGANDGSAGRNGDGSDDGATGGADDDSDTDRGTAGSGDDGGSNSGSGTGSSDYGGSSSGDDDGSNSGSAMRVPGLGGTVDGQDGISTPGSLSPPFPFESLLLAFLFVVPMNFVIQAYGSTMLDERVKRRGELLLVAPVSRSQIVAGKTLPYLLALLGIVVTIAWAVGGGPLSVAATAPIALLFLAATFAAAMLARSFKELTFVTVTISVTLTTYVFVPAIFADVTPIALVSPLTIVVMDLQGESVTVGQYLFSTGPLYLAAAVLTYLSLGSYREEDLFTQKPIPAKLLDVLAVRVRSYRSVAFCTALFIPFVFAGQLLSVALLFAIPATYAIPILLVTAAAIEEVAKSIHVYAGFTRSRFEATLPVALAVGAASGTGFFAGEKLTHLVQFVGLPELAAGEAVFGPSLPLGPAAAALFVLPLVLHVVTATVSAVGASRGRTAYAAAVVLATLVHAGYNAGVIALVA